MAGTGASLKGLASRGTPRSLQWEVSSGKMVRRRAAVGKGNGGVPEDEDTVGARIVAQSFLVVLKNMPAAMRATLRAIWRKARLGQSATSD